VKYQPKIQCMLKCVAFSGNLTLCCTLQIDIYQRGNQNPNIKKEQTTQPYFTFNLFILKRRYNVIISILLSLSHV
jgi:hypothetical protein